MNAPRAKKIAKELVEHGHTRIDNYYWMRLSDEQKNAAKPDEQSDVTPFGLKDGLFQRMLN